MYDDYRCPDCNWTRRRAGAHWIKAIDEHRATHPASAASAALGNSQVSRSAQSSTGTRPDRPSSTSQSSQSMTIPSKSAVQSSAKSSASLSSVPPAQSRSASSKSATVRAPRHALQTAPPATATFTSLSGRPGDQPYFTVKIDRTKLRPLNKSYVECQHASHKSKNSEELLKHLAEFKCATFPEITSPILPGRFREKASDAYRPVQKADSAKRRQIAATTGTLGSSSRLTPRAGSAGSAKGRSATSPIYVPGSPSPKPRSNSSSPAPSRPLLRSASATPDLSAEPQKLAQPIVAVTPTIPSMSSNPPHRRSSQVARGPPSCVFSLYKGATPCGKDLTQANSWGFCKQHLEIAASTYNNAFVHASLAAAER